MLLRVIALGLAASRKEKSHKCKHYGQYLCFSSLSGHIGAVFCANPTNLRDFCLKRIFYGKKLWVTLHFFDGYTF